MYLRTLRVRFICLGGLSTAIMSLLELQNMGLNDLINIRKKWKGSKALWMCCVVFAANIKKEGRILADIGNMGKCSIVFLFVKHYNAIIQHIDSAAVRKADDLR